MCHTCLFSEHIVYIWLEHLLSITLYYTVFSVKCAIVPHSNNDHILCMALFLLTKAFKTESFVLLCLALCTHCIHHV